MPVYLSFLEGAAQALVEALHLYERQRRKEDHERDAYAISRAIDSAHLAADRMLKHSVAQVDPYLLLANPRSALLRDLRRVLLHGGASSIFTSSVHVETLGASDVLKVVREVIRPTGDAGELTTYEEALQKVTRLRNQVQHGELSGESELLLANVKELLGSLYSAAVVFCPEFLDRVADIDGQAVSRLKAFQQEIDGAWQVLLDYLAGAKEVSLEFTIYIGVPGPDEPLRVNVGGGTLARDSLSASLEVPREDATGLFNLFYDDATQRSRSLRRTLLQSGGAVGDEPERPDSGDKPRGWNLLAAFAYSTPSHKKPLPPLDSGTIRFGTALGSLWLHLRGLKGRSMLSVSVALNQWHIDIQEAVTQGTLRGELLSARGSSVAGTGTIAVSGRVELDGEYVLAEPAEELHLPPGSVWRILKGTLTLSLPH